MKVGRSPLAAVVAASAASGCAHAVPPACPASPRAEAEIEETVQAFYQALRTDDLAAFRRVTTDRFYTFDGGDRYDGLALAALVRDARAKGTQFYWSVGRLDTQRQCDVGWSAWENVGSVGVPPNISAVRWLESAVLVYKDGQWRIDFFHSHRATTE